MSQTVVLPQGTYPVGTYNLGPAAIPQGASHFNFSFDGTSMTDPALHVSLTLDISLDGGVTWASTNRGPATDPFPVSATYSGGALNRSGGPIALYTLQADLPSPTSTTRQVRAVAVVTGLSLTTKGTLTLT